MEFTHLITGWCNGEPYYSRATSLEAARELGRWLDDKNWQIFEIKLVDVGLKKSLAELGEEAIALYPDQPISAIKWVRAQGSAHGGMLGYTLKEAKDAVDEARGKKMRELSDADLMRLERDAKAWREQVEREHQARQARWAQ